MKPAIAAAVPLALAVVSGWPLAAAAETQAAAPPPAVLQDVIRCRGIADDQARLRCFDAGVAQLDSASTRGDIAVFDKEKVVKTRRALFGFTLPSVNIFGHAGETQKGTDQDDGVREISATIRAVDRTRDGGWSVTLEDGARWDQTDDMMLGRAPKPGMTATIRRAALGSFKMSFGVGPAIRVRRVS